ncbi:dihydrofolate reductase-like domain-containing protein [Scleroderma yunnanense]
MSGLTIIVAATKTNGIGLNGTMPWHISKDLSFFSHVTSSAPAGMLNAVIMGRGTWESIPSKNRPLKNRLNVVLSRNREYCLTLPNNGSHAETSLSSDLQGTVNELRSRQGVNRLFIMGGASLYQETLSSPSPSLLADRVLLTRIHNPDYPCDEFLPDFLAEERGGSSWRRASHAEFVEWAGLSDFNIPDGIQEEHGVKFEFQMWVRLSDA